MRSRSLRFVSGAEGSFLRILVFVALSLRFAAIGQGPGARTPQLGSVQFEVVSIRPSRAGSSQGTSYSYTPDGYHARGQTIWQTILIAYYPLGRKYWGSAGMKGAPDWVGDQLYDIDAKVAENDQAAWQAQGSDGMLLKAALRNVLADRCHLALHENMSEAKVLKLVAVSSSRDALRNSSPAEKVPDSAVRTFGVGQFIPTSGDLHFYQTSMEELAAFLTNLSSGPIFDGTGLAGRYDFVLPRMSEADQSSAPGLEGYVHYQLTTLGLGLKSGTASITTLAINHVEIPSAN